MYISVRFTRIDNGRVNNSRGGILDALYRAGKFVFRGVPRDSLPRVYLRFLCSLAVTFAATVGESLTNVLIKRAAPTPPRPYSAGGISRS